MSGLKKPHVVAVPFPALGHLIPFFDLAKLLASNGLVVSYVTTPANVSLLHGHLPQADLDIRLVALPTPAVEGLLGRERFDLLPVGSRSLILEMLEKIQCPPEIGKGSGTLVNTFHGIEDFYVEHLKNLTAKPVWAVGPVHQQNLNGGAGNVNSRGEMVDIGEEELVCWLDSRTPRSVVYISFGSHNDLSEEQAHALARALEASKQPFVLENQKYRRIFSFILFT